MARLKLIYVGKGDPNVLEMSSVEILLTESQTELFEVFWEKNWAFIASGNGLFPVRKQAIIWTYYQILSGKWI